MIRKKLITIFAVTTMVAMIQTAQASFVEDSLADLVNNQGSLTIGDKTFSNFSFHDSGLTSFNAAGINVIAEEENGMYYLRWQGNMSFSSGSISSADLILNYAVTAGPGWVINAIDQSYAGSALNGYLSVVENADIGAFGGQNVGHSQLQIADISDPPAETLDILNIVPPQTTLYVTKDMAFAVSSTNGGFVTISQVSQSFHQVPEPTTMIAGALLLLPFGASTLRILRKNRTT